MDKQTADLRHNYLVNILDASFFGIAFGFASLSTVLPLFVSSMTSSAFLIGLIPAIHYTTWQLPQLFNANRTARLTHFKTDAVKISIHERIPYFFLAILALFLPTIGPTIGLVLTFLFLIWQGLGGGFAGNPWQNMIAKVIPQDSLATFYGLQSSASSLTSAFGATMAGIILEAYTFPQNFFFIFFIASIAQVISWLFLNSTREPIRPLENLPENQPRIWQGVKTILKKDKDFRWFLMTRMMLPFSMMAFAFYSVYAVRVHGIHEGMVGFLGGAMMIAQVTANPILGWLADRWSRKRVLEIGAIASTVSSFLAFAAPNISWFFVVFILAGLVNTVYWTVGLSISVSFGTEAERPTYIGMSNTLIAPCAIIAPMLGGWLADMAGYPATFIFASAAGLISLLIIQFFVHIPQTRRKPAFI